MIKIFIFIAASALALIAAGVGLTQNPTAPHAAVWPDWIANAGALWIPLLFAFVIVGFGTVAFQRIGQR
ncbi:MAG: hypothetical protein Q7T62_00560 [Undibacterium sp.]|nr:hypothetical protein [Undibacterium sp.]